MLLYSDLKNTLYDIFETYEFKNGNSGVISVDGDEQEKYILVRNKGNLNRPDMIMSVVLDGKYVENISTSIYKSFKNYKKFMKLLEEMLPEACDVMEVHYEW